jgi:hypothetical protein
MSSKKNHLPKKRVGLGRKGILKIQGRPSDEQLNKFKKDWLDLVSGIEPLEPAKNETLTKRDIFALGLAIRDTPLPANAWEAIRWLLGFSFKACSTYGPSGAQQAYKYADAMLAESKRQING